MGKGGGKGGKGRIGKFIGLAAGIAFGFGGGAWVFLKGVSAFSRVMYGLSLGMSIGGLFDKSAKTSTPESTFDSKNNQVTSEGTIPIIYGQSKAGGLQTYHHMDVSGRKLLKHVIVGEGEIEGFFGATANGYLLPIKNGSDVTKKVNIFGIRNNKWQDATAQVSGGSAPSKGFRGLVQLPSNSQQSIYQDNIDYKDFNKYPKLVLRANGKETYIFLTEDNTKIDDKYSLACNTFGKVYQIILGDTYLSDLQKDGWELVDPVICQDSPNKIQTTEVMPCYKKDVFFTTNGDQDAKESTVVLYKGESDAEAPSSYLTTGGYPNIAYMVADLRYTDKMGAGNPTITAIVKGRKVYDWRTKQTKYSKNPAVCLYDYLTNKIYGAGEYITPDLLDMESFTDVANYCDEVITYNDPYGVTKSEKRYELDIILNETKTHLENIQSILNSFLGFVVFSNNKIKLRCERLETPVYAFNDDNIVENSLSYKSASIDQSPNKFNLTYVEPALDYTAVKLIVEDTTNQLPSPIGVGRPIEQDIEFKGVRRQTQCLRLGKIARDIIRLCPITVTFKTGLMASHLEAGDIVTISKKYIDENGEKQTLFENQQIRITEIKEEDGTFEISGRQYNPSIYDDAFGASLKVFAPTGDNSKEINLLPDTVKPVENISVEQVYRQRINGIPTYDAVLSFTEPDDINFNYAQVSVQIEHNGVLGDWKVYGASKGIMPVIGLQRNDKVHFRIIPYDSKDLPHEESMVTYTHTVVPKIGNPSAPSNVNIRFTDVATISWKRVTTADIDRYEVRSSESLTANNLLLMTSEVSGEIDLTRVGRNGTVWVYAVNSEDIYSSPTKYGYNVPKPSAPTVTTKAFLQSFRVTYGDIPKGCTAVVRIDNKDYRTKDTLFVYNESKGLFNVSVAFEDYFGIGDYSPKQMVEIEAKIPAELLDKEALGINSINQYISTLDGKVKAIRDDVTANTTKISNAENTLRSEITQSKEGILTQVKALDGRVTSAIQTVDGLSTSVQKKIDDAKKEMSSQITQTANAIQLKVEENLTGDKLVSKINLSSAGTLIDGRLLHVTGQAKFDDNIITDKMLKANSVSADKIKTDSLSAISANLGDVRSGTITSSTIKNDNGTFMVDPNGNIRGANITGSTISADSIINAGFKVKNIDYAVLTVAHGQDVPAIGNYGVNECVFIPIGYNFTEKYNNNADDYNGRKKYNDATSRKIGKCTIYLQGQQPWVYSEYGAKDLNSVVGLNNRTAVCESTWNTTTHYSNRGDRDTAWIALGVIYVLVIGKKG